MSIAELIEQASDEAIAVAEAVLRDDIESRAWAAQVGPSFSQRATAKLLGKSEQAVAQDRRLFRVRNRDDRPAYPAFQFDGRYVVEGLDDVTRVLSEVDDDLTVLSWLTIPKADLGGRTPANALRDGECDAVLAAARRWVARTT